MEEEDEWSDGIALSTELINTYKFIRRYFSRATRASSRHNVIIAAASDASYSFYCPLIGEELLRSNFVECLYKKWMSTARIYYTVVSLFFPR